MKNMIHMRSSSLVYSMALTAVLISAQGFAQDGQGQGPQRPGQGGGQRPGGGQGPGEGQQPGEGQGQQPPPPPPPPTCQPMHEVRNEQFVASQSDTCLVSFYSNFRPNCNTYNTCRDSDYNPGPVPADNNTDRDELNAGAASFQLTAGQSLNYPIVSVLNTIHRTYSLINDAPIICISSNYGPQPQASVGATRYFEVYEREPNCQEHTENRSDYVLIPGLKLDTPTPQEWRSFDQIVGTQNFTTPVSVKLLPNADFPKNYSVSGNINQAYGQLANVVATSRYFTHTANPTASATISNQAFEISSQLTPIPAPNQTRVAFDLPTYTVTITDPDISELSGVDPSNKTDYQVSVYVNHSKLFGGPEKLGDVLAGSEQAKTSVSNNQSTITLNLAQAFTSNKNFKDKILNKSVDWAIYVVVTPTRTNKYVQSSPASSLVTEFSVNKKLQVSAPIPNYNNPSQYLGK